MLINKCIISDNFCDGINITSTVDNNNSETPSGNKSQL